MWNDENDNLFNVLEFLNNKGTHFPINCPTCKLPNCHIYLHSNGDTLGSLWIWCSHCKEYIHTTYIIPKWWENCPSIETNKLQAIPNYLEENKIIIDEWVNNLLTNYFANDKKDD